MISRRHRRERDLHARAFPDVDVRVWRARLVASFVAAVCVAALGVRPVAVLVLVAAAPTAVRYVRRELALGALLAAERGRAREARRVPSTDLRVGRPPI